MAPPVSPRSDVPSVAAPPTEDELYADYEEALLMSLSSAEKSRLEVAAKREEEERAQQEAAMAFVREEEQERWLEA